MCRSSGEMRAGLVAHLQTVQYHRVVNVPWTMKQDTSPLCRNGPAGHLPSGLVSPAGAIRSSRATARHVETREVRTRPRLA